jgi:hypothetical protein
MTAIIMMLGLMITAKRENDYRGKKEQKKLSLDENRKPSVNFPKQHLFFIV